MPASMEPRQRTLLLPLPTSPAVNVSFHDLKLTVRRGTFKRERKSILKGVSGLFKSGEVSAIMGPSGAGKSTLLNALTGFSIGDLTGEVRMDGIAISPGRGSARSISCYIMQEDHLNPVFSALEIMTIAAHLKLGRALPEKAKQLLIEDILDSLGLGSIQYTKCQRLSGGQKKRLCIALELIDNPPIMYLDEPTTGLDSSTTAQLVRLLKGLALDGRTIVCTIHQPAASVFEIFDHAYMMADGICLYQGSPRNLVPFLQTIGIVCPKFHNPVDFMLDVMSGEFGDFNGQLAIASKDPSWRSPPTIQDTTKNAKEKEAEANTGVEKACVLINSPSEFSRFFVLIKRNATQLHRDWTSVYLRAILHTFVGVIVGLMFINSGTDGNKALANVSYFFVIIVYLSYTSFMPAVLKFPVELNTLKKEQFNNWYKLRTYFIAFLITQIPIQVLFCSLFLSSSYYLSSQLLNIEKFLRFTIVSQLTIFISECLGLTLGTADNPVNGIFWGSVILAIQILLAGFLAIVTHMPAPLYYISFFNYMRYGIESLTITAYGDNRGHLDCPSEELYCHFKYPEKVLKEIGMMDVNYWADTSVMVGLCVFFTFNAYYFLHRKIKNR